MQDDAVSPPNTRSTFGQRLRARLRVPSRLERGRGPALPLSLALQGGGAHGAFSWGVLDRLLEENIAPEAISGASAGAMNAVVLASGWQRNGRDGAREALETFWKDVSRTSNPAPLGSVLGTWGSDWSPSYLMMSALTKVASPYQFNPTGYNPLVRLLERHVDFDALRHRHAPALHVALTNVHTGALRVLGNDELSPQGVAASACLPFLFQAVELDGQHYWDGGYSGNPPLLPLLLERRTRDLLLVQLSPVEHPELPRTPADIVDRAAEIGFNTPLLRELEMMALVAGSSGRLSLNPLRRAIGRLRLHRIEPQTLLQTLTKSSRVNTEWGFLRYLHGLGREHAARWLDSHRQDLGRRSSLPLAQFRQGRRVSPDSTAVD